jgi:UDP-N-acetylmuramate--L-alanine ligase/UDP-N-acetylenolpyruvoylglucosamine reductase
MGIGGQGISAVAQMAQLTGSVVTGCDQSASATTRALERVGIPVQIGHSPEHLVDAGALIYVPAVVALNPDNPELLAARERGMQVMTWQEMLGELMRGKCTLSVSGVHGKGTTTALLALMLVDAGLDPTCEVGAVVPRFEANYRLGKSQYFVNEADEFNHNFWHYHPRLAVVTSIEFEHPEFFTDYTAFLAAFEHFIRGMDMQGDWPLPPTLILNADSPGCLELFKRLSDWPGRTLTYSVGGMSPSLNVGAVECGFIQHVPALTYQAYDVKLDGETSFRVHSSQDEGLLADKAIRLQLPGIYNVQNALAALTAARAVGIDPAVIVRTLEGFGGIRRRFELRHQGPLCVGESTLDVILVDDYAHHPTAIAAALEAARKRYPGRRLVAVYQPHMFSRTKTFFDQFLHAFDLADVTLIADIFPGREHDAGLISARDLVEAMAKLPSFAQQGRQVMHSGDVQATLRLLKQILRSGDVVLIMGAGDIYTVTEMLLQDASGGTRKTFNADLAYAELYPHFRERVRRDELLARHGTFGVGGPADIWVTLDSAGELVGIVCQCIEQRWPLLAVGNGTNVLYADAGVRGIVARIAFNSYSIEERGDGTALLVAGAGVSWPRLLNELASLGWGGLEFGPGIPGTLGGGVISNAGAHHGNLGQSLEWVEVLDARSDFEGQPTVPTIRRYQHDELNLAYRHSRFRAYRRIQFDQRGYPLVAPRGLIEPGEIIMQLGIRLHREDPQKLRATIEEYKQHRKRTQPPQQSAGSVFKNPVGDYAGRLIEQAGLKGMTRGRAQISQRHANFIVNLGGASAADVATLIMIAHNRVHEQFGVDLELEVELRGEWGV